MIWGLSHKTFGGVFQFVASAVTSGVSRRGLGGILELAFYVVGVLSERLRQLQLMRSIRDKLNCAHLRLQNPPKKILWRHSFLKFCLQNFKNECLQEILFAAACGGVTYDTTSIFYFTKTKSFFLVQKESSKSGELRDCSSTSLSISIILILAISFLPFSESSFPTCSKI